MRQSQYAISAPCACAGFTYQHVPQDNGCCYVLVHHLEEERDDTCVNVCGDMLIVQWNSFVIVTARGLTVAFLEYAAGRVLACVGVFVAHTTAQVGTLENTMVVATGPKVMHSQDRIGVSQSQQCVSGVLSVGGVFMNTHDIVGCASLFLKDSLFDGASEGYHKGKAMSQFRIGYHAIEEHYRILNIQCTDRSAAAAAIIMLDTMVRGHDVHQDGKHLQHIQNQARLKRQLLNVGAVSERPIKGGFVTFDVGSACLLFMDWEKFVVLCIQTAQDAKGKVLGEIVVKKNPQQMFAPDMSFVDGLIQKIKSTEEKMEKAKKQQTYEQGKKAAAIAMSDADRIVDIIFDDENPLHNELMSIAVQHLPRIPMMSVLRYEAAAVTVRMLQRLENLGQLNIVKYIVKSGNCVEMSVERENMNAQRILFQVMQELTARGEFARALEASISLSETITRRMGTQRTNNFLTVETDSWYNHVNKLQDGYDTEEEGYAW